MRKRYHVTGVAAFHVKSGKIRHGNDYVFDQQVDATAYPTSRPSLPIHAREPHEKRRLRRLGRHAQGSGAFAARA
jgi:hypothetical protein